MNLNPPLLYAIWYMQSYSSQSCSPAELCCASDCRTKIELCRYNAKILERKFILQFDLLNYKPF